ncbi:MAG: dihydrolipoamide succinyltransferase [Desulfobulbaceae bacterium BRH_c16a]|nr:MAG: dihydrolipoamide succinyltransferase [Desulfobulbaceae bacterium BRH_c16a]
MIIDIRVPDLGESITEVEIGEWLVQVGDTVHLDDSLVAIESEKATLELPAAQEGTLVEIVRHQGETARIGEIIGRIETERPGTREYEKPEEPTIQPDDITESPVAKVMPSAARVMAQEQIPADQVTPTGPGGRVLKEDAVRAAEKEAPPPAEERHPSPQPAPPLEEPAKERRVHMSLLRRTIAARLLQATQSMAMLTTFNEADMSEVKKLRTTLGPPFAEKYGVRLGFMSFFVKAAVAGLRDFPLVNARIDGDDIVYRDNCDIGVAIGGGKGLVVPVIRQAEGLNFARIEQQIADFGRKAKDNTLSPEELRGGTFTISNGGVYGSMLSTPIVNPPQSAILGLHAIKDRPVAVDGLVQIRPVMYLALSYDHRIIDGREAVSFLKSIKERIEQPQKLLLEI